MSDFHEKLFSNSSLKVLLFDFPSSQHVFVESTVMLVKENTYMAKLIFEAKCKSEHKFKLMFRNLA